MDEQSQVRDLGIGARLSRSKGRSSRDQMANARVTRDEQKELAAAARAEGKALSEWAREVLLERARKGKAEAAVFTELIALRLLLNGVLRPLVLGEALTREQYQQLLTEVRNTKHDTARDVLAQYQPTAEGK